MKWIKENELEIIIWSMIFGILLCIYAGYQLVYHPSVEIKRTVITLPEYTEQVRSYGVHAGDAP